MSSAPTAVASPLDAIGDDADPVEDFFALTETLLKAVHTMFPECEVTKTKLMHIDVIRASNMRPAKEALIETWYAKAKPFIKEIIAKNDNVILRANIEALDELRMKDKWREFEQEDKDTLWGYINSLTYLACLHHETTPDQIQGLAACAKRIAEAAEFRMEGGRFSFNAASLQTVMSGQDSNPDLARLMSGMGPLMSAMGMGGGAAGAAGGPPGGLPAFLQGQMSNFASMIPKPPPK